MGLVLLPFLTDHACLVAHNSLVYKLKFQYKDLPSWSAQSLSRQAAHHQLEEVLRAVLYVLERDQQTSPIQTKSFVVHPTTTPWCLASKIEFIVEGNTLQCYPNCLNFQIQCKQIPLKSNERVIGRDRGQNHPPPRSREKHDPHNVSKDSTQTQTVSDELNISKVRSVPILHTPSLGASVDTKQVSPPRRKPNILSVLQNQTSATATNPDRVQTSRLRGGALDKSKTENEKSKTAEINVESKSHSVFCLDRWRKSLLAFSRKGSRDSRSDVHKEKSIVENETLNKTESRDVSQTPESLSVSSKKLLSRHGKKFKGATARQPMQVSKVSQENNHKSKDKGEDESPSCGRVLRSMESSGERRNKIAHKEDQQLVGKAREGKRKTELTLPQVQPSGHQHGSINNTERKGSEMVGRAAARCIPKFKHESAHMVLRGSNGETTTNCFNEGLIKDHSKSDSSSNANESRTGGKDTQNDSPRKEMNAHSNVRCLEMQDSDIFEICENGSIVSPTYTPAARGRKRRNVSLDYPQKSSKADGNFCGAKKQKSDNMSLCSPKRVLYTSNSGFVSLRDSSNSNKLRSAHMSVQSSPSFQFYRQKLVERNASRLDSKQESPSEASAVETRGLRANINSHAYCKDNPDDIISQYNYKKVLQNVPTTQTKHDSARSSSRFGTTATYLNTIQPNRKRSNHPGDRESGFQVEKNSSDDQQSGFVCAKPSTSGQRVSQTRSGGRGIHHKPVSDKNKKQGEFDEKCLSSVSPSLSPSLRPRSRYPTRYSTRSSTFSSPRPRRKRPVRRVTCSRSTSKLETLRRAQNRLLAAKDGVWLLNLGAQKLSDNPSSSREGKLGMKNMNKRESRRGSGNAPGGQTEDSLSTASPRTRQSASSPCLTTPVMSERFGLFHGASEREDGRRGSYQNSRLWQVVSYFFGVSRTK